jgi:hypothetical protein
MSSHRTHHHDGSRAVKRVVAPALGNILAIVDNLGLLVAPFMTPHLDRVRHDSR